MDLIFSTWKGAGDSSIVWRGAFKRQSSWKVSGDEARLCGTFMVNFNPEADSNKSFADCYKTKMLSFSSSAMNAKPSSNCKNISDLSASLLPVKSCSGYKSTREILRVNNNNEFVCMSSWAIWRSFNSWVLRLTRKTKLKVFNNY